jgi:hypothetical protein
MNIFIFLMYCANLLNIVVLYVLEYGFGGRYPLSIISRFTNNAPILILVVLGVTAYIFESSSDDARAQKHFAIQAESALTWIICGIIAMVLYWFNFVLTDTLPSVLTEIVTYIIWAGFDIVGLWYAWQNIRGLLILRRDVKQSR